MALAGNVALAQVTLSPVAVVGSDLGIAAATTPLENMINQSGITEPFVSGSTSFDTYFAVPGQRFATSGEGGTNNWQSEVSFTLPLKGYVDFDLGAVYQINKIAIWNRSLKEITVKILEDLNGPEQIAGSFTLISRLSFGFSYAVDVLSFERIYQGRYVRLAIDSVHTFSPRDTFGYAIAGEVVLSAAVISTPGQFPTLVVRMDQNGDVTLTFTGTLQSASSMGGTFVDVPGNPQGTHTLPKGSLSSQQYFRSKGN